MFRRSVFVLFFLVLSSSILACTSTAERTERMTLVIAGTGVVGYNGENLPATSSLMRPSCVWGDSTGNIFVAVENRIRKIDANTKVINTIIGGGVMGPFLDNVPATEAYIDFVNRIFGDTNGRIYFTERNRLCYVDPTSPYLVRNLVGTGLTNYNNENLPGTSANVQINDFWISSSGDILMLGSYRIRKWVSESDRVITVVGTGVYGITSNIPGPATSTRMAYSYGITGDTIGNFYFSEYASPSYRIRIVSPEGIISTYYSSSVETIREIWMDSVGAIYFGSWNRISKLSSNPAAVIELVAGTSSSNVYNGDGISSTLASLSVTGFWVSSGGNVFVADNTNFRVLRIANQIISTYAGTGDYSFFGDNGPASLAQLYYPRQLWVSSNENLFISDVSNFRIRLVSPVGIITTFAGNGTRGSRGDGREAISASFNYLYSLWGDSLENIYVGEYQYIRKITRASNIITRIAGGGSSLLENVGATLTSISYCTSLWIDSFSRYLYYADAYNRRIRRIDLLTMLVNTIAGNGNYGIAGDGSSALEASFNLITSIWGDSSGSLFIADSDSNNHYGYNNYYYNENFEFVRIRKISNGIIQSYAGSGDYYFPIGEALAQETYFNYPGMINGDTLGNIYLHDNYGVKMIYEDLDGVAWVRNVAGSGKWGTRSSELELSSLANISYSGSLFVDTSGSYFVAENGYNWIRKFFSMSYPSGQPTTSPSVQPSTSPTIFPSGQPVAWPTSQPSNSPTASPTTQPSEKPTALPTDSPTSSPTQRPTKPPTSQPTDQPTNNPTSLPSSQPSAGPTPGPSSLPSVSPSVYPTTSPSVVPSAYPTCAPSSFPSVEPTAIPSVLPSSTPSSLPTVRPSRLPSAFPSGQPSSFPTSLPSARPSVDPTALPSSFPSIVPTSQPTVNPSTSPTTCPSAAPTTNPTSAPSSLPTSIPSSPPSCVPSSFPSSSPSSLPTAYPSPFPTGSPSNLPSSFPSATPSARPSEIPSSSPSATPSCYPTALPSKKPSSAPSSVPTNNPSTIPSLHPTYSPTSVPSASPSSQPTLSPTVESYPEILSRNLKSISEYNAEVSFELSNPGIVYAVISQYLLTASQLLERFMTANYVITVNQTHRGNIAFSRLKPATDYTVYLKTESKNGIQMNTTHIITTELAFRTLCCRSMMLQLASESVQANESIATFITVDIEANPRQVMTLSLSLWKDGILVDNGLFPPSWNVSSSSASELVFALNPISELGSYTITAELAGSEAIDYRVHFINSENQFSVFGVDAILPAPTLLRAVFSSDGSFFQIVFSAATNQGGLPRSFNCERLLSFSCSTSSRCEWTDNKALKVWVSTQDHCLKPGGSFKLQSAAKISAACGLNNGGNCSDWPRIDTSQSWLVSNATNPIAPTIGFSLPVTIGECTPLTIDLTSSSGSGGRSWNFLDVQVRAIEVARNITSLQNFVRRNRRVNPPLIIPGNMLSGNTSYRFEVTLCNFLGICSVTARVVRVIQEIIPSVKISGPIVVSVTRSQSLSLFSEASASDCNGRKYPVVLEWGISSSVDGLNLGLQSTSRDPSRFQLLPYTLNVRSSYNVTLTGTVNNAIGRAVALVRVVSGRVHARITGNPTRSVRISTVGVLDARESYDEDVSPAELLLSSVDLSYSWSCVQLSPVFSSDCLSLFTSMGSTSSATLSFTPTADAANRRVQWTVTVKDASRTRSSSASVVVNILPALSPVINLGSNSKLGVINSIQSLQVVALIEFPTVGLTGNLSWDVTNGDDLELSAVALTSITQFISTSISSSLTVYLAIKPNSLTPGVSYTFQLLTSLVSTSSEIVTSAASITITVNLPPIPGVFQVDPEQGTAFVDFFVFSCSRWEDDNLPLTYQFSYLIPGGSSNGGRNTIRSASIVAFASTLLPNGLIEMNDTVVAVADIYDSLRANTTMRKSLKVVQQADRVNVSTFLENTLDSTSSSADDLLQGSSLATFLLNKANCSLAPDCSRLNRLPCFAQAHTCGSCLSDDYIGYEGDSNTACLQASSLLSGRIVTSLQSASVEIQTCPGDCSGHGRCVYQSTMLPHETVDVCYIGDMSCTAKCVCDQGYDFSMNCEATNEEIIEKISYREKVIAAIQRCTDLQDFSEQAIDTWINGINGISQAPHELSDLAIHSLLKITSTAIIATKENSYSVSTSLSSLTKAVDAISQGLIQQSSSNKASGMEGRRKLYQSSELFEEATEEISIVLRNYSLLLAQEMLPGQTPNQVAASTFKLYVSILDPSQVTLSESRRKLEAASGGESCKISTSIEFPQSSVEQYLNLPSSTITIPMCMPENSTSLTVSLVSFSSALFNASVNSTVDPLSLYLSPLPCLNSSEERCQANLTLTSNNDESGILEFPENITVSCKKGIIANKTVHCGSSGENITVLCRGEEELVNVTCPGVSIVPHCYGFDRLSGAPSDIGCKLLSYASNTTSCSCPLSPANRLESLSSSVDKTCEVNYMAMLGFVGVNFRTTIISAQDLNAEAVEDSWQTMVTLGSFLTVIIIALALSYYADQQVRKKIETEERAKQVGKIRLVNDKRSFRGIVDRPIKLTDLADEALPEILATSQSFSKRVWREMKRHHRWLGVIYFYSPSFPRILRVISLTTNIIVMLFLQSLTYNFTNGNDGSCESYRTEAECLETPSAFGTGDSMCYWLPKDADQSSRGSCHYVQPDDSIKVIIFVAIFSALVSTPIALFEDWIIHHILAAPEKEASSQTEKNSVAIVPWNDSLSVIASDINTDQQKLQVVALNELEILHRELLHYRDSVITSDADRKEFNELWGLDKEGQFRLVKTSHLSVLSSFWRKRVRPLADTTGKQEKTIKEMILQELIELHQQLALEQLHRFSPDRLMKRSLLSPSLSFSERNLNKRLLYLFQKDLLPGIAGQILENKDQRDESTIQHLEGIVTNSPRLGVTRRRKVIAATLLAAMNLGMLFYVFLFASSQDQHRQTAWGQTFAVWLVLEVLLVSTVMVILLHVFLPSLIMRDVVKIKEKLIESIGTYYDRINHQSSSSTTRKQQKTRGVNHSNSSEEDHDTVDEEDDDLLDNGQQSRRTVFNAAHYLFLSYRLAEQFPDLKVAKIILSFTTPWPRQSYQHVLNINTQYGDTKRAIMRSFSIIIIFFLTSLLSMPLALQDLVLQAISTVMMGYTLLIHVQLYEIFPALIIIPTLVIAWFIHFYWVSQKHAEEIQKVRFMQTILEKRSKGEENVENMKINSFPEEAKDFESMKPLSKIISRQRLLPQQHITRRQSVQHGIHKLEDIAKELSSSSTSSSAYEGQFESDELSSFKDETISSLTLQDSYRLSEEVENQKTSEEIRLPSAMLREKSLNTSTENDEDEEEEEASGDGSRDASSDGSSGEERKESDQDQSINPILSIKSLNFELESSRGGDGRWMNREDSLDEDRDSSNSWEEKKSIDKENENSYETDERADDDNESLQEDHDSDLNDSSLTSESEEENSDYLEESF